MFKLMISLIMLSALGFSSDVVVEYEERVKKTGKEVVLAVGNCVYDKDTYGDIDGNHMGTSDGYSVRYHVCEEKVKYQVKITKAAAWYNWKSKTEEVEGSESEPFYEDAEKVKSFTDYNPSPSSDLDLINHIGDVMTNRDQCEQQRDLLLQQKELDKNKEIFAKCLQ